MTTRLKFNVPKELLALDKKETRRVLTELGKEIADTAKNLIQSQTNAPSKPGEAPASRTGKLASSMTVKVLKDGVSVTDGQYYSLALEAGAKGGGAKPGQRLRRGDKGTANKRDKAGTSRVLEPRPYLSTALDQLEGDISKRIEQALVNGISLKETK